MDALISNSGIVDRSPVLDTTPHTIQQLLDTNVLGAARVVHAFTDDAAAVATSSELMAVYVEAPCWFRVGSVLVSC